MKEKEALADCFSEGAGVASNIYNFLYFLEEFYSYDTASLRKILEPIAREHD